MNQHFGEKRHSKRYDPPQDLVVFHNPPPNGVIKKNSRTVNKKHQGRTNDRFEPSTVRVFGAEKQGIA
jgi:hypothetical protein